MSVFWGTHPIENDCPYHEVIRSGGACFYCHRVLEFPCIFWSGETQIFLHVQCAALFASRLLDDWKKVQDGREVQLKQLAFEARLRQDLTQSQAEQAELQDQVSQLEWQLARLREAEEQQREQLSALERENEVFRTFEIRPAAPEVVSVRLDPQRAFSSGQKKEIYLRANGHCVGCGQSLDSDWHADHIVPHARGGRTEIVNGQALCQPCNNRKSAKVLTVDGG